MGGVLSCCDGGRDPIEELVERSPEAAAVYSSLQHILREQPAWADQLKHFVSCCQKSLEEGNVAEAQDSLGRIQAAIRVDSRRLKAAFQKFDSDHSGELEVEAFRQLMNYMGFGQDVADAMLASRDAGAGDVGAEEIVTFVGKRGGIHAIFERRRAQGPDRGHSQKALPLQVGARVRAYCNDNGRRSASPWDARVLHASADGKTARLEFGTADRRKTQDVPCSWVCENAGLQQALGAIGILEDAQHCWTILLPDAELSGARSLTARQSEAVFTVRRQSTNNHNEAVRDLRERCIEVGLSAGEFWSCLTWIRDLAPIVVHVDLDALGSELEQETHLRNQFEAPASGEYFNKGLHEHSERNLFGSSYDGARPYERPKYGFLDVMNDHRGVVPARHEYGDSYLVLRNVRLRCTLAPEDAGATSGERLAVLDHYAHVLMEFTDDELREVARVANAERGSQSRIGDSTMLNSFHHREAHIHGEVDLTKHVARLVVHPRHRVDGWNEERLRKLCSRHQWEFMWMDDERKRRINEAFIPPDPQVLEMSWQSSDVIERFKTLSGVLKLEPSDKLYEK